MIFESSMQLWITHNGEREKLRFPVLPTKFDVTHGTKNTSVTISGLGEILVLQDRAAVEVSWDGFFPAAYFPGIQTPFMLSSPDAMMQRLFEWKISAKPVHLILTGTRVNFYAAIQSLQPYRKGGAPGASTTKSSSRSTERSESGRSKSARPELRPSPAAPPGQTTECRRKPTRSSPETASTTSRNRPSATEAGTKKSIP